MAATTELCHAPPPPDARQDSEAAQRVLDSLLLLDELQTCVLRSAAWKLAVPAKTPGEVAHAPRMR